MNGFFGVTDNERFACGTVLKQDWPKAQGVKPKTTKSHWAKECMLV